MRIIRLSSNNSGFKTINFNPFGLSLIVGRRHNNDYTKNKKSTYNSVGKSLSIALIHFCLGSNKNIEFERKLKDWEFTLEFEIDGVYYTATRSCSNQGVISLNHKDYKVGEFTDIMASKVFRIPVTAKYLTFRSLITRFIRPQKSSYVSYNTYIKEEQEFNELINNAFLLGLDVDLILDKFLLKDELDKVKKMKEAIDNDPIMRSFFNKQEDNLEIDIVDLKDKISRLESNLLNFKVAEDYYEVVKEADEIKYQLKNYENKAASYKVIISNIDKSLVITPDVPRKKIIDLYREAGVLMSHAVIRKLEEVEDFNRKILNDRSQRLTKEKRDFETKLADVLSIIKKLGKQKDEKLEYLNTRGALDEFTSLNIQLKDYKIKLDNIEKFRNLKEEYQNRTEFINKDFIEKNIKTLAYLSDNRDLIERNIILFKRIAEEFYENKRAGIEIKNNDGINKNRFDIKAKIDDDKGDGVNDVKIFCFDWTLLLARHNHNVDFIFHDSRLLSEIDSRQVAILFNVAYKNTVANNLQYICSVNQNTLDSLKVELGEESYNEIIQQNIVLELTDESDESKLLGMQIDFDYDKES